MYDRKVSDDDDGHDPGWYPSAEQLALLNRFAPEHQEAAALLLELVDYAPADPKALRAMLQAAAKVRGWGERSEADRRFEFLQSLRRPFDPASMIDPVVRRLCWGQLHESLLSLDDAAVARSVASAEPWAWKAARLSCQCGAFGDKRDEVEFAATKFESAQREASRKPRSRSKHR